MKRATFTWGLTLLTLGSLIFVSVGYSRVFRRWGGTESPAVSPEELRWNRAYRTTMSVNGGTGDFDLLESGQSLGLTLERLEHAYRQRRGDVQLVRGETMAWGVVRLNDRVVRILAFSLGSPRQTLVARIEQSLDAFRESGTPPERHELRNLPIFPGSVPSFHAVDESTQLALETSTTSATPAAAKEYIEGTLAATGWMPAIPPSASGREVQGLSVFLKGAEICCVSVNPSGVSGESMITMVHKKLNLGAGF